MESVPHTEVLAPPDIEARYGLLGGNIFQGEMSPDQLFSLRPIFGYGDYRPDPRVRAACRAGRPSAAGP